MGLILTPKRLAFRFAPSNLFLSSATGKGPTCEPGGAGRPMAAQVPYSGCWVDSVTQVRRTMTLNTRVTTLMMMAPFPNPPVHRKAGLTNDHGK